MSQPLKRLPVLICIILLVACGRAPGDAGGDARAHDAAPPPAASTATPYSAQLARFRVVAMTFDRSALTDRQQQLVAKLAEANRLLDELFWEQSDPEGLALYRKLAGSTKPEDQDLRRLLRINGSRYDLLLENQPFAGAPPRHPGANLYPADLTRAEFDAYVQTHPAERAALYDPYTVVRRHGDRLVAIPYRVAYARWLAPMAQSLRDAAALSDDAPFAAFLRARADALLSDDYYASDLAWLDLEHPQVDLIYAPYETYLDNFLGVKTSYGGALLVRNDAESRKLEVFQKFVPDIQQSLPLPAADKPSKQGQPTPMEVMESPARGGDLRHGYQAVADNLPNDPRVHEKKGTKKIFFRNFLEARTNTIVLPIAAGLLREDQAASASAEGYLSVVLMHEVAHGIGPAFARTLGGKRDIREAIGPAYSGLEESKADIVALFALKWLADHGGYEAEKLNGAYASYVAGTLRTVRFGVAEAHGRGSIMQFNYFTEQGAIRYDTASGRYSIDYARMPAAVAALAKQLLEIEATGDRARAEAWFAKYGTMTPELAQALERVRAVPADIDPVSDYPEL